MQRKLAFADEYFKGKVYSEFFRVVSEETRQRRESVRGSAIEYLRVKMRLGFRLWRRKTGVSIRIRGMDETGRVFRRGKLMERWFLEWKYEFVMCSKVNGFVCDREDVLVEKYFTMWMKMERLLMNVFELGDNWRRSVLKRKYFYLMRKRWRVGNGGKVLERIMEKRNKEFYRGLIIGILYVKQERLYIFIAWRNLSKRQTVLTNQLRSFILTKYHENSPFLQRLHQDDLEMHLLLKRKFNIWIESVRMNILARSFNRKKRLEKVFKFWHGYAKRKVSNLELFFKFFY